MNLFFFFVLMLRVRRVKGHVDWGLVWWAIVCVLIAQVPLAWRRLFLFVLGHARSEVDLRDPRNSQKSWTFFPLNRFGASKTGFCSSYSGSLLSVEYSRYAKPTSRISPPDEPNSGFFSHSSPPPPPIIPFRFPLSRAGFSPDGEP